MHSEEDVQRPFESRSKESAGAGRCEGYWESGATSIEVVTVSVSADDIDIFAKPVPEATTVAIEVEVVTEPFSSMETEQKSHPTATEMTSPSVTDSEMS